MYEFLGSDEMEQVEAFWGAVFVGERLENGIKIICKQLNDFYIEYKIKNEIYLDMRVFKNPDLLQPYLDKMLIQLPQ